MNTDHLNQLERLLSALIKQHADEDAWRWLSDKTMRKNELTPGSLTGVFAAIPRKINKSIVQVEESAKNEIAHLLPGFSIQRWSLQQLCRVWLLMQANQDDKEIYIKNIEAFFNHAEMNELVALYAALPVLAYPEAWRKRCAEGIRSNIGTALEAIMYENPYPAAYLDEPAWNQLALKALFTDKEMDRIVGLDSRANKQLAVALFDYARERRAAKRTVNIQLWRLVGKFLDETNFSAIQALFNEGNSLEKKAAALACSQSNYEPARFLLRQETELEHEIRTGGLNWTSLVEEYNKIKSY